MDKLFIAFFFPIALGAEFPLLALGPTGGFLAFYFRFCRRAQAPDLKRAAIWTLASGLVWLGYALYEFKMRQWSKTVTAPIRVDLLLLTPVLYSFAILGIGNARRLLKSRWFPGDPPSAIFPRLRSSATLGASRKKPRANRWVDGNTYNRKRLEPKVKGPFFFHLGRLHLCRFSCV